MTERLYEDVTGVRVLARYILLLTFTDGSVRVIDTEKYLWGPVFEPLLADYGLFCQVRADPELGTIVWPGEADLAPELLWADSKPATPTP